MADETFQFNRALRYFNKTQDTGFTVKYTVQTDPIAMPVQIKNAPRASVPKQKSQSVYSEAQNKKTSQLPIKQAPAPPQPKNAIKDQRRKKRVKKMLQFKKEQAEIFKEYNKFNHKKMKIKKDDEDDSLYGEIRERKQKKKKEKGQKNRKGSRGNKSIQTDSQDDLRNIYHSLTTHEEPKNRRRVSQSIESSQKFEEHKFLHNDEKMSRFYEDKKGKKTLYPPYMSLQDIQDSRQANEYKYFKGTIDFSEKVKYYARIFSKQVQGDLIVQGVNKNRCIQGDEVYFEVLQKDQLPKTKDADTLDEKIRCRVVYILPWKKDGKRKIVGKIQFTKTNKTYYLVPINKRIISFDVKFSDISKQNLKKVNQKYFLAEFTEWKETDQYPSCRILSEYGEIGQIETETGALLISNGVEDKEYNEEIVQKGLGKFLKQADEHGEYKISEEQIKSRADLRNETIFTIDPLTARDFDDALSIAQCGKTQNGEKIYEIGVHIADASFFVEEGGLIDQRAQETTTSVYLVHRVLPMLPRVLCQTMCSLNPGLQRLTLSVWFKLTEEGQLLPGSRYDRSVIKSKARFTYEQAQKIIKNQVNTQKDIQAGFGCVKQSDFDEIAEDLKIMNSIAQKVRQRRIKGGSLIFQTPKKSFVLDQNFYPQSICVGKRFEAHYLVEEYMLLANQKVGQILVQNIKASALLRRHKFPSQKKIQKFQKFTLKINQPIKITKQVPMQQQMNKVMKNPKTKQCIKDVLNYQMIFLLQQAQYFVVGDTPKEEWLHYALNMPVYTHFTSPIRRYPDIIVHRQLISIINAKKSGKPHQIDIPAYKKLKQLVDRCNKNKISAKKVSSGCQKIFICLYLKTHPVFCKAVLTDLNQYALSICVPSYDFRSAIQFKEMKKVKPLQFNKDSSQRKYVQIQCQYEPGQITKMILKQMQEIDVRLTAKEGFPIDYMIRLMFPHPKDFTKTIACQ